MPHIGAPPSWPHAQRNNNTARGAVARRDGRDGDCGMPPTWIRPLGIAEHVIVGGVVTALLAALGTPALARVVAVAAVGLAHEWGDRGFTKVQGAPWNGTLHT